MMNLPAGLLPSDPDIEIFSNPNEFGKCLYVKNGQTRPFHELPVRTIQSLYVECFDDAKAVKALQNMGVMDESLVEHYNFCNRGRLDSVPDVSKSGKTTKEYFDCGRRGKCEGENIVCSPLVIEGSKITYRESECLRLIAKNKSYKQIMADMGFRSETAVNSLIQRLREKMNCKNMSEIAVKAIELGIA